MVRDYHDDRIPTVYSRSDLPWIDRRDGVTQAYFRGLDIVVGFTHIEPGAAGGFHDHPWEQITMIQSGACTFHVGSEAVAVEAGDMFVVPPDVPHYAEPDEGPCLLCFISPLREDFLPQLTHQTEFHRLDIDPPEDDGETA